MKEIDIKYMDSDEIQNEIKKSGDKELTLVNALGQRYIASALSGFDIRIKGTPGNALASYLDGATLRVDGNCQDAVADTMNDGALYVNGSCGDALAYAMRGGKIFIRGNAGYRAGVHMKAYKDIHPTLVIGGTAGSFLGEYLAGGTIIVLGLKRKDEPIAGYFCGNGMYAGTIYLKTDTPPLGLSKKLKLRKVEEDEIKEKIAPYLKEFSKEFSIPYSDCISGSFIAIEADEKNRYKEQYVAI